MAVFELGAASAPTGFVGADGVDLDDVGGQLLGGLVAEDYLGDLSADSIGAIEFGLFAIR